jgi:hypothetical protein
MRNRRTIILAVLGAAGACILVVAALFVFRSRPAPASPPASPATPSSSGSSPRSPGSP